MELVHILVCGVVLLPWTEMKLGVGTSEPGNDVSSIAQVESIADNCTVQSLSLKFQFWTTFPRPVNGWFSITSSSIG